MRLRFFILFLCFSVLPILAGCLAQSSADEDYHPGIGTPRLTVSTSQSDPFGSAYVGGTYEAGFSVCNVGTSQATGLSGTTLSAPYAFSGGAFPGTGGTCGSTLNAGVCCTVAVAYSPTDTSSSSATLEISYHNGSSSAVKSVSTSVSKTALMGSTGALDTQTFGSGTGIVTATNGEIYALAVQTDGKILAVGSNSSVFSLARYETDGSLDSDFGMAGEVTTTIGTQGYAYGIALQDDGKIVLVGMVVESGLMKSLVARYNTDGSLDTAFGSSGYTLVNAGSDEAFFSVGIQSDGNIVAAGYAYTGGPPRDQILVARFDTDGNLDAAFGSSGIVTTSLSGSSSNRAYSLAIQSDQKILVAGWGDYTSSGDFGFARFATDGSLDTSFNSTGKRLDTFGSSDDYAFATKVQSDGKIVTVGVSATSGGMAVNRLTSAGASDGSFGGGQYSSNIAGSAYNGANTPRMGLGIQSDGKIIFVARRLIGGGAYDFTFKRLNSDGTGDSSFGTSGLLSVDLGTTNYQSCSMILQSDGKILTAGDERIFRLWP